MANLVPYINFEGKSKQAVEFYKTVFGGDAEVQEDNGVVVQLEFTANGIHFMGSDHQSDDVHLASSTGYGVVLNCDSEQQLGELYTKLADGGKEIFAPVDSGWGAVIAHCTDRFGVSWMLNYDK